MAAFRQGILRLAQIDPNQNGNVLASMEMLEAVIDKNQRIEFGDGLGFSVMAMLGAMDRGRGEAKVSEIVNPIGAEFLRNGGHNMNLVSLALQIADGALGAGQRLDIRPASRLGEGAPNLIDLLSRDPEDFVESVGAIVALKRAANHILRAFAKFVDKVKNDAVRIQNNSLVHRNLR